MKEDIKDYVERYPTYLESLDQIDQLKQQLAETEQKFLEFQEDSIRNERTLIIELAEKDKEIAHLKEKDNYHLRYELAGADETITNLKQQLEEKDKEIERLKVFEKAYYFNQLQASQEDIQQFQQLANQSAVNINHIAITELEKVIDYIKEHRHTAQDNRYIIYVKSLKDQINKQIKELKGEKDAED